MFKKNDLKHYNEDLFQQEDFDELRELLEVEKLARQQAVENKPSTHSEYPNADENKFTAYFQEKFSLVKQEIHKKISLYDQLANKLYDIGNSLAESKYASENFKQDATTLSENYRHKLNSIGDEIEKQQKDLKSFKINNNLTREAQYPESKLLHIGLILVFILLETVLNSYFFAKGNELGLLGGASQAFVISIINMLLAYFFGNYLYRNLYLHNKQSQKYVSIILMILVIGIVIVFNLLVGHLRVQLGIDPEYAYTASIQSFLSSPFYLQDFDSIILVGIGLLMFILGSIDFFKMDDAYPQYGKLSHKLYETQNYFTDTKEDFFEELTELQSMKIDEIEKKQNSSRFTLSEVQELPVFRQRLDVSYKEYYSYLNKTYKSMIALYRNTNKEERKDAPPTYFSIVDELDNNYQIECIDNNLQKNINKAKKEMQAFPHIIGEQKSLINGYVKQMIDEIKKTVEVPEQHETTK